MNNILRQYNGFLNTPNLLKDNEVKDLSQFELPSEYFEITDSRSFNEVRLGKRVEQFFNFQIENSPEYEMLANNLQIRNGKLTIGELDALIQSEAQQLHIEIIYKFYLYDPNIETKNELDKWIGPNRKDTLIYKLDKLKEKQLPLLYSKFTKAELNKIDLKAKNLIQNVCYKAQLFLPFQFKKQEIQTLNNDCVFGFYLSYNTIDKLSDYEIFIPRKLDWLVKPHFDVNWLNFETGKSELNKFIVEKRSPMIWLKSKDDKLQKCFIIFW